jgi:hypothetical protein
MDIRRVVGKNVRRCRIEAELSHRANHIFPSGAAFLRNSARLKCTRSPLPSALIKSHLAAMKKQVAPTADPDVISAGGFA